MSLLTSKQRTELHKAIFQYISAKAPAEDSTLLPKLSEVLEIDPNDKEEVIHNYLEKKWTTVVRLQKKILDLENEVASYKSLIDSMSPNGSNGSAVVLSRDKLNWLPNVNSKTYKTSSSQYINSVAVHPSLPLVVAGASDGSLIAWNLVHDSSAIPEKLLKVHTRSINRICWSPEPVSLGSSGPKHYLLASCSQDLTVRIWQGDALTLVRTLTGHEHTVSSVAFSPSDSNILYSVSRDCSVRQWDLAKGSCIRKFVGHSDWVRDVDAASVEHMLAYGSGKAHHGDFLLTSSNDQSVRLSHASTGTGLALLLGHTHVIECVKFLPQLSSKHLDAFVLRHLTDFSTLTEEIVNDSAYNETLGYKYCVSAGRDNLIKLWLLPPPVIYQNRPPAPSTLNNSQGWHLADLIGHSSWVKSLSIHPSGRFIFSAGDDKTIRIWDLSTLAEKGQAQCVNILRAHENFVNSVHMANFEVSFNDNEERSEEVVQKKIEQNMRCIFVTGGVDQTVRVWS